MTLAFWYSLVSFTRVQMNIFQQESRPQNQNSRRNNLKPLLSGRSFSVDKTSYIKNAVYARAEDCSELHLHRTEHPAFRKRREPKADSPTTGMSRKVLLRPTIGRKPPLLLGLDQ